MKPKDLDRVRDALRSIRNRIRQRPGKSDAGESAASQAASEPKPRRTWRATCGKGFDHLASIIFWVFVIGVGISIAHALVAGLSGYAGSFGFGNLHIMYSIESGGLLPERLAYAIITPNLAEQAKITEDGGFTYVFAGDHPVTVKPRRGEIVWIDAQYQVTSLDRALHAKDIAALKKLSDSEKPTISSPEEFLAIVARLKDGPTAPGEPPTE